MLNEVLRSGYPRLCPGCRDVIAPDMLVCGICADRFRTVKAPWCMKCGRHIEDGETEFCDECQQREHRYSAGFAAFVYDDIMRKAMSDLKFNGVSENADYFADVCVKVCSERIELFKPDVLVPVPIHPSKLLSRGYNQAQLISDRMSEKLRIPALNDLLVRNRKTRALKTLDSRARAENLRHAFTCDLGKYSREDIVGGIRRVLLVDDIYTTGTTMECCTEALLDAGVREVAILSVAIGYNY